MVKHPSRLTTPFWTGRGAGARRLYSPIPHREESRSRAFMSGWSIVRRTLKTNGRTYNRGTLPPASRLGRANRRPTGSSSWFPIRFGTSRRLLPTIADRSPWACRATDRNTPTGLTIGPGESKTYGLKFLVSDSIRHIEKTLADNRRPVAVGVPGYVLPQDIEGRLFLRYGRPVTSLKVEPASAIEIREDSPDRGNWRAYTLQGKTWGRSRLSVTYGDGTVQTIHYFVIKPSSQAVADMGHFLTTRQWFTDSSDPFHRAPAAITYDRETNRMVLQDSRVWIAGLSDEGGASSWLAAVMKELVQPDKEELEKLQQFVDGVLWGGLQSKDGPHPYGVRKSLFYYQPDEMPANYYDSNFDWKSW